MDPESRKLLEDTHKLAEENNEILRSVRRSMRVSRVMNVIYWVFIIGSAVGAFYLIEPYVDQFRGAYDEASKDLESLRNLGQ